MSRRAALPVGLGSFGVAVAALIAGGVAACISPVEVEGDGDGGVVVLSDGAVVPIRGSGDAAVETPDPFPTFLGGTNLSGAEFAASKLPGTFGTDYTYPTHDEVDEFSAKGFKIFRLPFLWERLQPTLGQMFDPTELGRITDFVSYATGKGAYVILDPHDFAQYRGSTIGGTDPNAATAAQFGAFWSALATAFGSNPLVVFGLMNEPSNMTTELWLSDANAAINGIRSSGATNVIFVPGNGYTGAWDWVTSDGYGTPNADVMLGIVDPLDRYVFEVHQYNDSDSSGTHAQCVAPDGSSRLIDFTNWLVAHHQRGFLGELATSTDSSCDGVLEDELSYIDQHRDVWTGWTWWSAGPWWGTYMFTLEPANGMDQPQMATLTKHL